MSSSPTPPEAPSPHRIFASDIISEDAAALAFAETYEGVLLYCHTAGSWYEWKESHWRRENTSLAFHFARELARRLGENLKHGERTQVAKASFAAAVERYARADRTFAVEADVWDRDSMLLATPGGTINLRNGGIREADPEDKITRVTAVTPSDSTDDCPQWMGFLRQSFDGNEEMIRFLQQWLG